MITGSQYKVINDYVSEEYFDTRKLKRYLDTHDTIGNEMFAYCDKGKGEPDSGSCHSYACHLDDERGFKEISAAAFVRRIPFYFYVNDKRPGALGRIIESLDFRGSGRKREFGPHREEVEKVYEGLEYLFYEKKFSLDQIFGYILGQSTRRYGGGDVPFLNWVDHVRLCDELGWDDYFPKSLVSRYNMALEAAGRDPVIYNIDLTIVFPYQRSGKYVEFFGCFPVDTDSSPVLRWTNVKVKDAGKITCDQVRSEYHAMLRIELTPRTVIYGRNFAASWEKDVWRLLYAGPLLMNFNFDKAKNCRKMLGFTQQEVADSIGTSVRTYQKWESGESIPEGQYLLRLMNWLGMVDPGFLAWYADGS